MNRILALLLLVFLLNACEKETLVPEDQWPQWLKTTIEEQEQAISDDPVSFYAVGAWKRTTWNKVFYYEYYNLLSSAMPIAISHAGDTLETYVGNINSYYDKEKCCGIWIWKGPDFIDLTD